jgi:hypothetical protein
VRKTIGVDAINCKIVIRRKLGAGARRPPCSLREVHGCGMLDAHRAL